MPLFKINKKEEKWKNDNLLFSQVWGELGGMGDRAPRDKVGDGSNTERTESARGMSLAQLPNREGFWNSSGMQREGGSSQWVWQVVLPSSWLVTVGPRGGAGWAVGLGEGGREGGGCWEGAWTRRGLDPSRFQQECV